ncbi:MAG: hypothetical protein CL877_08375 [Dehalococcoidales bacterium]|nr:hypothetical protein [Dehalococcoidales bacterium]
MKPDYVTFSNLIIDDIVLWDGKTFMGVLGGAGTHALVGMRVWSRSLGLVASVGRDVPETVYRQPLEALGYVDLRAIVRRENYQTARAWQLFEKDGTRTEVMRTDPAEFLDNTPRHEEMPDDYRNAKGFHVLWGRDLDELGSLLAKLRKGNPSTCLLWEPSPDHERGTPDQYIDILKQVDVFSPDIQQATFITGLEDVAEISSVFVQWGARTLAIRRGDQGSYVATRDGQAWHVPAVAEKIVDVTGAGNAYCGGLLWGVAEALDVRDAALRAAVSASFTLEQFGVPTFGDDLFEEATTRLSGSRQKIVEDNWKKRT